MKNNFEVITTPDKHARDRMFTDFRQNGDRLEKQVVKFSSNEPALDLNGFLKGYRSTWSVAYPKS